VVLTRTGKLLKIVQFGGWNLEMEDGAEGGDEACDLPEEVV
jgi:hypothetical protein